MSTLHTFYVSTLYPRSMAPAVARAGRRGPRPGHRRSGVALRRALALLGVTLVLAAAALAPAPAVVQASGDGAPVQPADVPAALRVPDDQALLFKAFAQGTQVYDCRPGAAGGVPGWALRQPVATLTDDGGQTLGIHGRGPFWAAYDGSLVVAAAQANVPAPAPAEDIPLLLLRATATEGDGRFAPVTFVQRLDTRGGVAPPGPCDPEREPSVAVPYLAVYYFYGPPEGRP